MASMVWTDSCGAMSVAVSPDGERRVRRQLLLKIRGGWCSSGMWEPESVHVRGGCSSTTSNGVDGLFFAWSVAVSPDGSQRLRGGEMLTDAVAVFWTDSPGGPGVGQRGILRSRIGRGAETLLLPGHRRWRGRRSLSPTTTAVLPAVSSSTLPAPQADFDDGQGPRSRLRGALSSTRGSAWPCSDDFAGARAEFVAGLVDRPRSRQAALQPRLGGGGRGPLRRCHRQVQRRSDCGLDLCPGASGPPVWRWLSMVTAAPRSTPFYEAINTAPTGDLFAAISAYNLQLLRGPGVSFDSDLAAQDYGDGLFNMRVGLFGEAEQDFISRPNVGAGRLRNPVDAGVVPTPSRCRPMRPPTPSPMLWG